ncbi:HAMP domain protein [Aeromicrobium marinum DSM 15272]|uniref:HAMP domain protein n=1 Tax=Aeromicrobium marinum DSM 15272 TaxID=585531 RepID=E2SCJ3_9ACTN|nr:HAMP domain protein [Aeromicrobium marinum DSM 15272]
MASTVRICSGSVTRDADPFTVTFHPWRNSSAWWSTPKAISPASGSPASRLSGEVRKKTRSSMTAKFNGTRWIPAASTNATRPTVVVVSSSRHSGSERTRNVSPGGRLAVMARPSSGGPDPTPPGERGLYALDVPSTRPGRSSVTSAWLVGPTDQSTVQLRRGLQVALTTTLVLTNVIGAVIVFGLSFIVTPGGPNSRYVAALAISVPVYVVAAVVVGASVVTLSAIRPLRWALEEREATPAERRVALRLPWRMTLIQFGLWIAAVVLFTGIALWAQPAAALSTAFSVGITGVVVSAIAYLFTEFSFRPIAARALAGRLPDEKLGAGVQWRMVLFWSLGTAAPVLGLVVAAVLALSRSDITVGQLASVVLGLAAVILAFGLLVTVLNARVVVAPIAAVSAAMEQVRDGELDVTVQVDDGTELGLLQAGFNDMAVGLRERERIRDLFGRHVGAAVATAATQGRVELGGETRTVSVLMIDLTGSTAFATDREPAEVVEMLNRFFAVVVEEVDRHEGLVNKFMGDAVLAIFGAPVDVGDHAGAALATARAIAGRLGVEVPEVGAGIGVSTGRAVAGNVGHSSRFEYTVIGDAVNAAARLTDLAKEVEGGVLVAADSVTAAGGDEQSHWVAHETVVLRGRAEPTPTARLSPA